MELNREQIIKALECCGAYNHGKTCKECPYRQIDLGDDEICSNRMSLDALALIKELTLELEAMRTAANSYKMHNEKLTEENERLRGERDARAILNAELIERKNELQKANEELGQYCQELEKELNGCADIIVNTVRKMQNRFAVHLGAYGINDKVKISEVFGLLGTIEKEMLEGEE